MILLDTNIISEMMKPAPAPEVIDWIDHEKSMGLFISTITIAEISYGLNALPEGSRRRKALEDEFAKAIQVAFQHRMLDFDYSAATLYGKIMAKRKALGRPLSVPDGQIAAIASSKKLVLATRNSRDFTHCGLEIVNPFNHPAYP